MNHACQKNGEFGRFMPLTESDGGEDGGDKVEAARVGGPRVL